MILLTSFGETLESVLYLALTIGFISALIALYGYLDEYVLHKGLGDFKKHLREEGYDKNQQEFYERCYRRKIDVSRFLDKRFSLEQLREIRLAIDKGQQIDSLCNPNLTPGEMRAISDSQKK